MLEYIVAAPQASLPVAPLEGHSDFEVVLEEVGAAVLLSQGYQSILPLSTAKLYLK